MNEFDEQENFLDMCIRINENNIQASKEMIIKALSGMPKWYQYEYRIKQFLKKNRCTQSVKDIVKGYREKFVEEYYISCTTERTVNNCHKECEYLYENGYLDKEVEEEESSEDKQKRLNCNVGRGVDNWSCYKDCSSWDGKRCTR